MVKVIDFNEYNSLEEALNEWLKPSLSLNIAINIPPDLPDLPISDSNFDFSPQPLINQGQELTLALVEQVLMPPPSSVPSTSYRSNARARRNPFQGLGEGEEESINPPFPWATDRRAKFYSISQLTGKGITTIWGEVECRQCGKRETMLLDLPSKFKEVENFVMQFINWEQRCSTMKDRAPPEWLNPVFAECSACKQPNCMKPLLTEPEMEINWLFLFLTQTMGICSLRQLKWFCKHTQNHRTGAKDRVLYYSYISLGKQIDPYGVFQIFSTA